jgi:hypothetical protein
MSFDNRKPFHKFSLYERACSTQAGTFHFPLTYELHIGVWRQGTPSARQGAVKEQVMVIRDIIAIYTYPPPFAEKPLVPRTPHGGIFLPPSIINFWKDPSVDHDGLAIATRLFT